MVQFCEELENPENGAVSISGTIEGSTANFTCNSGILVGEDIRVCQRNVSTIPGTWSGRAPICNSENNFP